jgi:hypothetical protein
MIGETRGEGNGRDGEVDARFVELVTLEIQ